MLSKNTSERMVAVSSNIKEKKERIAVYSSFTFSYLAKARVLAWSLKRFHPDWTFVAVITDEIPDEMNFKLAEEPFDEVIWGQSLPITENMPAWIFKHNIVEMCTAVKGYSLELIARAGYDKVVYLDPDIAVFNSLQPVIDILETNNVVLTPHQLVPETDDIAIRDNEIGSLKFGIYNLGFVAIKSNAEGLRFANWWSERLKNYCFDDVPNGLFTDQRWCDHAPVFFDGVHVLKDPGYNVASWNLSNRKLSIDQSGIILVNEHPLRFYHVTKFGPVGETMTARYALDDTVVYEIWSWYRRKLNDFRAIGLPENWWSFSNYNSGEKITDKHRTLYKDRKDLQSYFENPYVDQDGAASYREWYRNNNESTEQ